MTPSIRLARPYGPSLEVMYKGEWNGKGLLDKEFRALFDSEAILASNWYHQRLEARVSVTRAYWEGRIEYLNDFLADNANREASERLEVEGRKDFAEEALSRLENEGFAVDRIHGCLGTDPFLLPREES